MAKVYQEVIALHIDIAKQSVDNLHLIMRMSLKSSVIKECVKEIYKNLTPIEELPIDEKKGFWDYVMKEFSQYNKQDKIQLCKNMYVIGNLF